MESHEDSDGSESSSSSALPATWWPGFCAWTCSKEPKDEVSEESMDTELQAMIEHRDHLNHHIEEQMRRQNVEFSPVTDPSTKAQLRFMVPAVERQWRTEGNKDLVALGSLFLGLCELLLRTQALVEDLRFGCGLKGLRQSPALQTGVIYNICNFCILVPICFMNVKLKHKALLLFLAVVAYFDRLLSSLPLLHFACGRGRPDDEFSCPILEDKQFCQEMEFKRFHLQMLACMAQVLILPEYRYCSYMWLWIFLATLVSATFAANENLQSVIHPLDARNEFFVRLILLSLVQMVANRKKCTMEEQHRAMFLTDNKNRRVSLSMFKILEFMVPGFLILPMLKVSQNPATSLSDALSYRFNCASVLFMAFDDFESIVQQRTPPELLKFLNYFYGRFDVLCARKNVTKIETVAEEYVCAVGVRPDEQYGSREALSNLISFALAVLELVQSSLEGSTFKMGLHTGPVVAGVVGHKLPRYRLFGDTVNMAAQMMQKGVPGELQFGEATRQLLPGSVQVRCRGDVEMKGKGLVRVYLLERPRTEDRKSSDHFVQSSRQLRNTKVLYALLLAGKAAAEGAGAGLSQFDGILKEVFNDAEDHKCWSGGWACCPGGRGFPKELEPEYRTWYFFNVFANNYSRKRLQRHAIFLAILTVCETGYILFTAGAFYDLAQLRKGFRSLSLFLFLRAADTLVFLAMAFICPRIIASGTDAWHQRLAKLGSEALLLLCVQLLMLSYMLLPDYANEGSLVDKKDLEAKYSVPNNVVALLFLPVYSAVMMSYQQDFLTSVVYIAAFTLTVVILALIPNTKTNGYPAEGVTFLGYSMIFALKAFMGERSHRQQFRGRHAIDEAKRNIEGILETMMPQQVFEELQRLPAGSTAPSHHYFRATLVQSDLTGFTAIASQRAPEWVVKAVSDLFGMYDSLAEQHGIYKLETVGDAYLAGQAEPPLTHENHPPSVVSFGLKMVEAVRQWSAGSGVVIGVRVGVHTGECVGGIVGIDAQRYHLFGKLLHELEILESTAPENGCQVSLPCKSVVGQSPDFVFLERREPHLTTSKGEVHYYSEVHGRSFIVQATS